MPQDEIEGYELFQEKVLNKANSSDGNINAPSKPLEVKSLKYEDMTDEEKKEQEAVYKALEDKYCICNHKKEKHVEANGKCNYNSTMFSNGKIQLFKCECLQFKSKKEQREQAQNV